MSDSPAPAVSDRFRRYDREVRLPNSLIKHHLIEVRTAVMRAMHTANEDLGEIAADKLLARDVDALISEVDQYLRLLHRLTKLAGGPTPRFPR